LPGLLPTPAAGSFNDGESLESWQARNERLRALGVNGNGTGTPLAVAVALLKTPTAQLAINGGSQHPDKRKAGGHGPTLADQVEHELLPTPVAGDGDRASLAYERGNPTLLGALLPTPSAADATGGHKTRSGDRKGEPLLGGIAMLLPTPTAMDSHGSRNATTSRSPGSAGHPGTTLSDVFWTGDLTDPPSHDGKPS
jgi:DNA (cytosine-5)-methyltransferase 1